MAIAGANTPDRPMSFTYTFPADFAGQVHPIERTEDGKIHFGPYVYCFSSAAILYEVTENPITNFLLMGTAKEFTGRAIFESALESEIDVVLNPYIGVSYRFTQDKMRQLLDDSQQDA